MTRRTRRPASPRLSKNVQKNSAAAAATDIAAARVGWFALSGSEINDNGCVPFPNGLDKATVGTSAQNPYLLQREFNNAGVP